MTHKTYMLHTTNRITSYNDIHSVLTHSLEILDKTYVKSEAKSYLPDFKLLEINQDSLKIATELKLLNDPKLINYEFIKGKNEVAKNIIAISGCSNIEEYNFQNADLVKVNGVVSYSKHYITQRNKENGKVVKNERVVSLSNKETTKTKSNVQVHKEELSSFFARYGLEILFNKESSFVPSLYNFNCDVENKKRFKDVFKFSTSARIIDASKANKLACSSMGRSKSYGFGAVWISAI